MKIAINSRTSGKFRKEKIGGRAHIVTTMMPIRGDITMNNIYYPDADVKSSFEQLDMMPAPNGHPTINGENVPAFHPVAVNAFNIGGFVRNPRKKGKRVFVDFCLDVEVANRCDDGKQLLTNIKEGKKVGVSTGLTIASVTNSVGKDDFGKEYSRIGHGFNFDHVAILMDGAAAGEHAGTELILNEEGDNWCVDLVVNELTIDELRRAIDTAIQMPEAYTWVQEVYPESHKFIYSFEAKGSKARMFKRSYEVDDNDELKVLDDTMEVMRKVTYEPVTTVLNNQGDTDMDRAALILAIIGNAAFGFTGADKDRLEAMSESEIVNVLATNADQAKVILTNAGFDFEGYENFKTNKSAFDAFTASETTRLDELRSNIVANSEYTAEMLADKPEAELDALTKMLAPKKKADRVTNGQSTEPTGEAKSSVDYS